MHSQKITKKLLFFSGFLIVLISFFGSLASILAFFNISDTNIGSYVNGFVGILLFGIKSLSVLTLLGVIILIVFRIYKFENNFSIEKLLKNAINEYSNKIEEAEKNAIANLKKDLNLISIEEIIALEKEAKRVWVFSPTLNIELHHEKMKETIKRKLIDTFNHYKKHKKNDAYQANYLYILPDSIDESRINEFKNRYSKIISRGSDYSLKDANQFLESIIYLIPSEQILNEVMQEGMIYNPLDEHNRSIVTFPFISKNNLQTEYGYKLENGEALVKRCKTQLENYKNIGITEEEATEVYVTTIDLAQDLKEGFKEHVKQNMKKQDNIKRDLIRSGNFFDLKYKYILFYTSRQDERKQLTENIKRYKKEILNGLDITIEDLFIQIDIHKISKIYPEVLDVFGAEFQERTIHKKSQNKNKVSYLQIIDVEKQKIRAITNDKIKDRFTTSFMSIWNDSLNLNFRKVYCRNDNLRNNGKQIILKLVNKYKNQLKKDDSSSIKRHLEQAKITLVDDISADIKSLLEQISPNNTSKEQKKALSEIKDILLKYHY